MNQLMDFVWLKGRRHLIDLLNPLPYRDGMLLIERIRDELLRLIFLALELEFFAVEPIGAAKSWNPAWS